MRDHKFRELAAEDRTLEAHYGNFVLTQAQKGESEARRCALAVSYGREPRDLQIAGHAGRAYERGPEPPPDDIDGRSPSVATWYDGAMHYFIASEDLESRELIRIGESMYLTDRSARVYSQRKRRI